MTKYLKQYIDIMKAYRNGEFGEEHLTMGEILEKASAQDLFDKMSLKELQYLIDNSSITIKPMFKIIYNRRNI